MSISPVMQGWITQQEFAKLLMIGSNGLIELTPPMTDDDRRDFEVHIKSHFGLAAAIQVKSTLRLRHNRRGTARYLQVTIADRKSRIVTNPNFWYFFAYFSRRLIRFVDPLFLVPSTAVHQGRRPHRKDGTVRFPFRASMEPTGNDKWVPYRVNAADLGKRMFTIIEGLEGHPARDQLAASPLIHLPGVTWFRPSRQAA